MYTVSLLLHIPERIPAIAPVRPDLILLALLAFSLIGAQWERVLAQKPGRLLLILIAWIIVTIPFVEWPGSVIRDNWKPFIKAVIFFFAIVLSITDRRRLFIFLFVFLGCQTFRVIEPLFLHITQGYWGSAAHIGGGEFMDRLSGAPADVTNPNGLAFIVAICVALMHPLMARSESRLAQIIYVSLLPIFMYTLSLTGSRSGVIVLGVVLVGLLITSKKRAILSVFAAALVIGIWMQLDAGQRDRYKSIISSDTDNAATAEGRIRGWAGEFSVAMMNPVFGHGIATSAEALTNKIGGGNISHNTYTEAIIELGFPGALIFFYFLYSSIRLLLSTQRLRQKLRLQLKNANDHWFDHLTSSLVILFFATIISSLTQYGLSETHWYLICGLIVTTSILSLADREMVRKPAEKINNLTQ